MKLFEAISSLADVYSDQEIDTPNEFYVKSYEIGVDFGKIISSIYGL
jgi:hypothetical protein